MEGLADGLIGLDPARQQAIIESIPEGKPRNDFLNRFISRSAYQDPVCAAKMLEFMEPHARQKALSESSLLGQLDGDATKETQATAGGMVASVSSSLFQENPQEAARWVAGLPAGVLLDEGISAITNTWVHADPVEASVWIRSLPAGFSKDRAVGQLINGIRESDPSRALAWAGSIGEEARRNSQMNRVFQSWIETDKTAALEALKTAPMSNAAKETIRQNAAQK